MHTESGRPTIVDVARLAGVSRSTASRALNGKDRVDERTRQAIQDAAAQLDYRPNVRAQRLRSGRSHSVALVTALPALVVTEGSQLGFMLDLAIPIAQACLNREHSLMLVPPLSSLDQLDGLDVDGAIVLDPGVDDELGDRFRSRGVTVVTFGHALRTNGYIDRGFGGAEVVFAHLAEQGAQHVGVLLSAQPYSLTESIAQYLASGQAPVPHTVFRASVSDGEDGGYAAALAALRTDPSIDAVYAPIDAFASGAIRAAHELGLDIPRDLMVVTNYDGRRATQSRPQLTALDLKFPQVGASLVDLLFAALESGAQRVEPAPAPTLVPRASTQRRQ